MFMRTESIADQIASLKKVLALDFNLYIGSHVGFLNNGKLLK